MVANAAAVRGRREPKHPLEVDLVVSGEPVYLASPSGAALHRVTQRALLNVLRHDKAAAALVSLRFSDDRWTTSFRTTAWARQPFRPRTDSEPGTLRSKVDAPAGRRAGGTFASTLRGEPDDVAPALDRRVGARRRGHGTL